MNTISISELKTRPSKIIDFALDYPVAIEKRNKVKAYLVGRELYEKLIGFLENYLDQRAVKTAYFKKGRDFEKIASELEI